MSRAVNWQRSVRLNLAMYGHEHHAEFGDPRTLEFAYAVQAFQLEHDLYPDGVFGPRTQAKYTGKRYAIEIGDRIVIGTKRIKVNFPVVDFTEPGGHSFYPYPYTWRGRDNKPDLFVLHFDACMTTAQCFQTLIDRGLSCQLMMDVDGVIWQALDLLDHAAHAGPYNRRSIGIEINNPWYLSRNDGRPIAEDQYLPNENRVRSHVDFTDAQKRNTVKLCNFICRHFKLPKEYPAPLHVLEPGEIGPGVVAHYHLSKNKKDPGLTLWPHLDKAGFKAV